MNNESETKKEETRLSLEKAKRIVLVHNGDRIPQAVNQLKEYNFLHPSHYDELEMAISERWMTQGYWNHIVQEVIELFRGKREKLHLEKAA